MIWFGVLKGLSGRRVKKRLKQTGDRRAGMNWEMSMGDRWGDDDGSVRVR